ncbi:MAG: APC family permease [Pseudomonadota bacterium]
MAEKKALGFFDLLSISLGQIIGSGVVIFTVTGIKMTGQGVPWAFLLALAIVILPSLSIAALGAAVPNTGGTYTYVRDLIGPRTAFVYLALLVAGQLVLASYAIGFATYAGELFSNINMTITAAAVMSLCFVSNLLGVKVAARFQSVMVLLLLVALVLFIAFGLPRVADFGVFTQVDTILPNGVGEFVAAGFLLRYSMIGSEFISELGGETRNPGKLIPKVMITSLLLVTVLYFLVAIVASGVETDQQASVNSLAAVASSIFPTPIYLFFMVGGVMLALVTTLNSIFAWCTKGLFMAIKDGWLPNSLGVTNRFGTPYLLLTIFYFVGMLPIVSGMSLEYVNILGNNVGIIFGIIPVLALVSLADKNPGAYSRATFKFSPLANKIIPVAAFVIYVYGVYMGSAYVGVKGFAVLLIYTTIALTYAVVYYPRTQVRPT